MCKNTTTTKQKFKHKNPCRSRGLNPGHLAPKADALPLQQTFSTNTFFCNIFYMHEQLYLAVSHIDGSRFRCLNMV